MKLVTINMPAKINSAIAIFPERIFIKYKPIIAMATSILITLSAEPMFFFILFIFLIVKLMPQKWFIKNYFTATFVTQTKDFITLS